MSDSDSGDCKHCHDAGGDIDARSSWMQSFGGYTSLLREVKSNELKVYNMSDVCR